MDHGQPPGDKAGLRPIQFFDNTRRLAHVNCLIQLTIAVDEEMEVPPANELDDVLDKINDSLQPYCNAKGTGWNIKEVFVDTFPPSKILHHPYLAFSKFSELLLAMSMWVEVIARTYPAFLPFLLSAALLRTISGEVSIHLNRMLDVARNAEMDEHTRNCPKCRDFMEKMKEAANIVDSRTQTESGGDVN